MRWWRDFRDLELPAFLFTMFVVILIALSVASILTVMLSSDKAEYCTISSFLHEDGHAYFQLRAHRPWHSDTTIIMFGESFEYVHHKAQEIKCEVR
jgi:hypothetical protein